MNCKIKINKDQSQIRDWSDDCVPLIQTLLQPLPHQLAARVYETSQLRAFNLSSFLRANGVSVDVEIADPADHARFTIWSEKLKTPRSDISEAEIEAALSAMQITYRDLQIRGLKKILRSHFAILAARCGAGKTLMILTAAQFKKMRRGRVLTIVVAPPSCAPEYARELNRYRGYFDLTMLNTCGMTSKKAETEILYTDADVVLVSVDSVARLKDAIAHKMQNFDGESMLVVEEGHSVKNTTSQRSIELQSLAPLFDCVIVSTATPLPLGPKDLRGYIGLVGLPQPEDAYSNGIPRKDYELLRGVAFVTDEDDVPYAPVTTEHIEFDDLEDLNARISHAVREELQRENKVVIFTATNAALQAAVDLFRDVPKTVLSGSFHMTDIYATELSSGSSKDDKTKAVDDFNKNPACRILIANFRVGSTGHNLQYSGARMAIFYEITNNGADLFQSKYRLRRPNVFPSGGFKYVYAIPNDPRKKRTVNRQFLKMADQESILKQIKSYSGGAL